MNKRHAKPSSAQLVARIYRKQIAMESEMRSALAMISARVDSMYEDSHKNDRMLQLILYDSKEAREDNLATLPALRRAIDREAQGQAHLRVTARTLADHCARLLREKETLMKIVDMGAIQQCVNQANAFIARRANGHSALCGFASTHQPGIVCQVCGQMQ